MTLHIKSASLGGATPVCPILTAERSALVRLPVLSAYVHRFARRVLGTIAIRRSPERVPESLLKDVGIDAATTRYGRRTLELEAGKLFHHTF
jgi:hypothetical protein